MSESGVGVSFTATRQNAGSVAYGAAAFGLFAEFGGVNAPACTNSADVTVPFAIRVWASASHAVGAAARAPGSKSDTASAATHTPVTRPIFDPIRMGDSDRSIKRY